MKSIRPRIVNNIAQWRKRWTTHQRASLALTRQAASHLEERK